MKPSLEQIRGVGDFLKIYNWNLHFVKLPVVGFLGGVASEGLNVRCESVELPKKTGQKITINLRGHQIHQPGIYNPTGSMTITFAETVDPMVHNLITGWQEACWETGTGKQLKKSDSEAILIIAQEDSEGNSVWGYKIKGAFLDDYDYGTLDGVTSDIQKPSITLSYDDFTSSATLGI